MADPLPVSGRIAVGQPGRILTRGWTFGANTCRAPLWLRDDLMAQVALAKAELGITRLRCHGMLNDSMVAIRPDGGFDFSRQHRAIDRLLALGLKPFFGLYAMPAALCRDDATITAYRMPKSPPRHWEDWYRLVRAAMAGLMARYGAAELRQWHFEVWNEPDIDFWNGTREEYFRLYDLAARAVKETDPSLAVGGPATARAKWIPEFCAHVSAPSPDFPLPIPRCDFVATHAYPSDLAYLEAAQGEVRLQHSDVMRRLFARARREVDAGLGAHVPLICGEWNSSAGPLAINHDVLNNGAFTAKTLVELEPLCQGTLFWALSDIYEECGFHHEPFHGGYGLITVNGVRKAAWHAFRLLAEHRGAVLPLTWSGAPDHVGGLATIDGGTVRVLMWNHVEPGTTPSSVAVALAGLGAGPARVEAVLPGAGSAYETYVELGRPAFASSELLARLHQASLPSVASAPADAPVILPPGAIAQLTMPAPAGRA